MAGLLYHGLHGTNPVKQLLVKNPATRPCLGCRIQLRTIDTDAQARKQCSKSESAAPGRVSIQGTSD